MKNKIIAMAMGAILSAGAMTAYAEAPTLMLVPDKTWCNANGFVNEYNRGGKMRKVEDYERAFTESQELTQIKTGVNSIFAKRGFPLKDFGASSDADDDDEMLDEAAEGAETGAGLQANANDVLIARAKPDILLKMGWIINKVGFDYSVSYRLEALDSYSGKSVAAVTGEGAPTKINVPLTVAIGQAMEAQMSDFCQQLNDHFADIQQNGREMRMNLRIYDNGAGLNFNQEFGGKELSAIVYDWMHENTQGHRFSERSASRNRLSYEQVRVPYRDERGAVQQARQFIAKLQRHLASLGIVAENATSRLGVGQLNLGEK